MIAALFDCDGTLFSAQFGRGLMQYASEQGDPKAVRAYYRVMLIPHILRSLKLISRERYHRPLISNLARMIAGWDESDADKGFDWVVNEYLLPTQFTEPVNRLNGHLNEGHRVILVSGILKPALDRVGSYYNASDVIGTKPEFIDGHYTGQIVPPPIMGKAKASLVLELLSKQTDEINWADSYAYADSYLDRDLLNLVLQLIRTIIYGNSAINLVGRCLMSELTRDKYFYRENVIHPFGFRLMKCKAFMAANSLQVDGLPHVARKT
jgi:HAD superfamily hydrolase (TIGR01490 family)